MAETAKQSGCEELPRRLRRLLDERAGEAEVRLVLRTAGKVDVGRWLAGGRLWVCATDAGLILLADGHDPCVETIEYAQVARSVYNPMTGRLVLAGTAPPEAAELALGPVDAQEILNRIRDATAASLKG